MDSSEDEYRPAKRFKASTSESDFKDEASSTDQSFPQYSDRAVRMMKEMGYKENTGLGRFGQGRVEPVETSQQKGRRGLGLTLEELDLSALKWDKNMESPLSIPERLEWYESSRADPMLSLTTEDFWPLIREDTKKLTIDNETHFCSPEVLHNILLSKSAFDKLGTTDMIKARSRANPFETIKHNIFQNRAAVKMANIDSLFNYMFSKPLDAKNKPLEQDDLMYFADICAGPGGFSEYLLYRRGWTAKGFGFTLKNENDFKLHEFYAGSPETFDTYYGIKNDGNIFDPDNCDSLKQYVMNQTQSCGVDVVMADGGFSVEGQENIQEILSKQLYLCQCMMGLALLKPQGNFVVKLFDIFTPFSVGLIYLISKCFDAICICKPNTSRPANSERYLVCKSKRPNTNAIEEHLFRVNQYLWENRNNNSKMDILELVPIHILKEDTNFYDYIVESNNIYGHLQIESLVKIAAFTRDINLIDDRQADVKKQCLHLWNLEDRMRRAPPKSSNQSYLSDLLAPWGPVKNERYFIDVAATLLNQSNLKNVILSHYDWYFVALEKETNSLKHMRTFLMSKGRRNIICYNTVTRSWTQMNDLLIEIPPRTLLYAEIVKEYIGESKKQRSITAIHIIDAIFLGGVDVRKLHLVDRIKMCTKFAKALNKPLKTINEDTNHYMTVPIRCKKLYEFKEFSNFVESLRQVTTKDGTTHSAIYLPNECNDSDDRYFIPEGLLFLNGTNEAFLKCFSKSNQNFYYFDKRTKISSQLNDKLQSDATASFKNTFINRYIWKWDENESNLTDSSQKSQIHKEKLCKTDFENLYLIKA